MCVRLCVCGMRVRVRVSVRAREHATVCLRARACVRVCGIGRAGVFSFFFIILHPKAVYQRPVTEHSGD